MQGILHPIYPVKKLGQEKVQKRFIGQEKIGKGSFIKVIIIVLIKSNSISRKVLDNYDKKKKIKCYL